jgi:anti-anti-sigma factor
MTMSDLCTIETRQTDRCTVVRLIGEIDMSNAASIDGELRTIAVAARNILIVDLNALEYIDSAGLAAMEHLATETGCSMVIAEDATIYQTLNVVGFSSGHKHYGSVQQALDGSE